VTKFLQRLRDELGQRNHAITTLRATSVLKLMDVARPVEGREALQRFSVDVDKPASQSCRESLQKMMGEQWNVFTPRPEGRQVDRKDVDSVEQIGPEASLVHRLNQRDGVFSWFSFVVFVVGATALPITRAMVSITVVRCSSFSLSQTSGCGA
jgi:hypothetical protein